MKLTFFTSLSWIKTLRASSAPISFRNEATAVLSSSRCLGVKTMFFSRFRRFRFICFSLLYAAGFDDSRSLRFSSTRTCSKQGGLRKRLNNKYFFPISRSRSFLRVTKVTYLFKFMSWPRDDWHKLSISLWLHQKNKYWTWHGGKNTHRPYIWEKEEQKKGGKISGVQNEPSAFFLPKINITFFPL